MPLAPLWSPLQSISSVPPHGWTTWSINPTREVVYLCISFNILSSCKSLVTTKTTKLKTLSSGRTVLILSFHHSMNGAQMLFAFALLKDEVLTCGSGPKVKSFRDVGQHVTCQKASFHAIAYNISTFNSWWSCAWVCAKVYKLFHRSGVTWDEMMIVNFQKGLNDMAAGKLAFTHLGALQRWNSIGKLIRERLCKQPIMKKTPTWKDHYTLMASSSIPIVTLDQSTSKLQESHS